MEVRKAKKILKPLYESLVWDKKRKVFKAESYFGGQPILVIL